MIIVEIIKRNRRRKSFELQYLFIFIVSHIAADGCLIKTSHFAFLSNELNPLFILFAIYYEENIVITTHPVLLKKRL